MLLGDASIDCRAYGCLPWNVGSLLEWTEIQEELWITTNNWYPGRSLRWILQHHFHTHHTTDIPRFPSGTSAAFRRGETDAVGLACNSVLGDKYRRVGQRSGWYLVERPKRFEVRKGMKGFVTTMSSCCTMVPCYTMLRIDRQID